ncbi:NAD(P)/FAD-dependent oxidoreductase [Rhizobium leguminosarum]|uniref:Uncharacterized protein n=1 Tax=Rhizobium leguminosarum TaxID=384 RepID=A0A7K3VN98_RHILE|nr:hypothetical protein [Rhizobium leguminosarum]NEK18187.1 hypothetical protein [Rhizobium leguminosarum]
MLERPDAIDHDRVETIAPYALQLLEQLGLKAAFLDWPEKSAQDKAIVAWKDASAEEVYNPFNPYGPRWHVRRQSFARFLRRAALKSGAVIEKRGGLLTELRQLAARPTWARPFLVDASGRAAHLARALGATSDRFDTTLSLTTEFLDRAADPGLLVEATRAGWWYSAGDGHGHLSSMVTTTAARVVALRRAGAAPDAIWMGLLALSPLTRARHSSAERIGRVRIVASAPWALRNPEGACWIAVGDAAFAADPLASSGVAFALESGLRGGQHIKNTSAGETDCIGGYASFVAEALASHLQQRRYYYETSAFEASPSERIQSVQNNS